MREVGYRNIIAIDKQVSNFKLPQQPNPGIGARRSNDVYGSAKALVHRYLGGMRHRLAPRGLRIVTMKPGPTDTPMTANYDQPGVHLPDPETVAQRILHGIDTGRTTIYVPGIWRWVMLIIRHIPGSIFLRMKL